jgi:hypothetical protein
MSDQSHDPTQDWGQVEAGVRDGLIASGLQNVVDEAYAGLSSEPWLIADGVPQTARGRALRLLGAAVSRLALEAALLEGLDELRSAAQVTEVSFIDDDRRGYAPLVDGLRADELRAAAASLARMLNTFRGDD